MPLDSDRTIQVSTPKTPRHRNALSSKIPVTPRRITGFPRKPSTPRTPGITSNQKSIYHQARHLFAKSAPPGRLVGRDVERSKILSFIQKGIKSKSGRCLYISGPPGTGKSAVVAEVCNGIDAGVSVRKIHINCMTIRCFEDMYLKLVEGSGDNNGAFEADQMSHLHSIFGTQKPSGDETFLVTLDEIDHLLTLNLDILYSLFEWSLRPKSPLVLIGIANALDLTDRFLPRLKARHLKPQLLPFLPYTAAQIELVITTKLKSLVSQKTADRPEDFVPFIQLPAIRFCSKKVAAQTGDLRKAFNMIERTIDLVEKDTRREYETVAITHQLPPSPSKSPLSENPNFSSPTRSRTPTTMLA